MFAHLKDRLANLERRSDSWDDEVGRLADHVLAVRRPADRFIDLRRAIAAGHDDRFAP